MPLCAQFTSVIRLIVSLSMVAPSALEFGGIESRSAHCYSYSDQFAREAMVAKALWVMKSMSFSPRALLRELRSNPIRLEIRRAFSKGHREVFSFTYDGNRRPPDLLEQEALYQLEFGGLE